jgi:soluble lytic murein transglycosylase
MNRDFHRRMIRLLTFAFLPLLIAESACAQSADRRPTEQGPPAVDIEARGAVPGFSDPQAARADSLTRSGRPWRATLLLAGALRTPESASPDSRLAGARAAAGWNGWTEVERLLRGAPWLDSALAGDGRELLARAALERGQPAADEARLALRAARTEAQRLVRSVLLARALDRAGTRDSAAALYASAASRLPAVGDWLRLRAAGVEADSAARFAHLGRVSSPIARARVPWTDAQARERWGDLAGASRVFRSVRAEPAALRTEALLARDPASRSALVDRIVSFLGGSAAVADDRLAIEVLDKLAPTLTPAQELVVARAAADAGVGARAVTGFERVLAAGSIQPDDQFAYAGALARVGRTGDAARVYAQLSAGGSPLAAVAAYQRARVLLQGGNGAGARAALRDVASRFPAERAAAAPALLLLADLQVDDGDYEGAARSLAELSRLHPDATQAPLAQFRAALLAWRTGAAQAAAAFDALAARHPTHEEGLAARYWGARAQERLGRRAEAETRWRAIAREAPLTYYGVISARRLRTGLWSPPTGSDSAPRAAWVDSASARVRALRVLGMDVEARFEIDALAVRAERDLTQAAAAATALGELGESARALRLALRAIDAGQTSRALFRAAYPVVHADALVESARRAGLDAALVAGLIRQESTWNPAAVSPVGARGLMQLMPSVGAALAAGRRYPLWNAALLFDPDVSLELGTLHLSSSLRGAANPARALAAYNAGASRVARWAKRPNADDPELFTEWIPYVETRDYVRVVQRNAAVYGALYGWR